MGQNFHSAHAFSIVSLPGSARRALPASLLSIILISLAILGLLILA
jgi:hypothetical protein